MDKKAYLAMLGYFNLRGAFPDLDFRAHDFRVDPFEPDRVWYTTRTIGTHKGTWPEDRFIFLYIIIYRERAQSWSSLNAEEPLMEMIGCL